MGNRSRMAGDDEGAVTPNLGGTKTLRGSLLSTTLLRRERLEGDFTDEDGEEEGEGVVILEEGWEEAEGVEDDDDDVVLVSAEDLEA